MKLNRLSAGLGLGLVFLMIGCPSVQNLSDNAKRSLNNEESAYQSFKEVSSRGAEEAVRALGQWSKALSALNADVVSVVDKVRKAKRKNEDLSGYQGDLRSLQEGLDRVFQRELTAKFDVPTWDVSSANSTVRAVYEELRALRDNYRNLYDVTAAEAKVSIRVEEDNRYYDTYADCVQIFHTATLLDPKKEWCLDEARKQCGHQTDLHCVELTVAKQAGLGVLDGSLCARAEWRAEVDLATGEEIGDPVLFWVKKDWFKDIGSCKSQTPIWK